MCLDSNLIGGIGINKSLIKAKDIEASKENKHSMWTHIKFTIYQT